VGYWLAPADLLPGQYAAHIQVVLSDQTITAEYPFVLSQQAGDLVRSTTTQGFYQLIIEGQDSIAYALGEQITYRLQLLDENGRVYPLTLDQVTSTLQSLHYEQPLPATQQEDGWLIFKMRVPYKAKVTTGLLFAVATLWLTEVIPLAAAAFLIPIVVVAADIADATTAFEPFAHPIIVLFLAGFLLAEGLRRTETDRRIALYILHHASLKPAYLMLTMMSLTAFLSMWMSNTASVAILIPIALAVLEKIPDEAGQTGFRRALILGVAYAGAIGGIGSAIGTPANILAMTFLSEFNGAEMAFIDWFAYGLPVVILMVPIIWLYLLFAFRVRLRGLETTFSRDIYEHELNKLGSIKRPQKTILILFLIIVILWLTEQWHHLPTAIVALTGVFSLFFAGIVQETDLRQINWNALITFGGGLAIGTMLVTTGVSDWVALQLTGLTTFSPLLVILLVAGLTLLAGAFISNTACAAMLIPLAIPLARILHIDPRLLVAVVAIASSIDFALVIGTPPTMMAYATGFFTTKEIFKRGIVLDLIGLLLLSLGVIWIWQWLGVVTLW
jgi:sodium-dependent dicarboxylate transporter 2/3/5